MMKRPHVVNFAEFTSTLFFCRIHGVNLLVRLLKPLVGGTRGAEKFGDPQLPPFLIANPTHGIYRSQVYGLLLQER